MIETPRNWAGNITFGAARLHHPETVAQVQDLVDRHRRSRNLFLDTYMFGAP